MKYQLKHCGKTMATGTRIGCEYTMQRLAKKTAEEAMESGEWTIDPITTKTITLQSKMNQWNQETENNPNQ